MLPCHQRIEPNMDMQNTHLSDCLICSYILLSTWMGVVQAKIVKRHFRFHHSHGDTHLASPFILSPGLPSSLAVT